MRLGYCYGCHMLVELTPYVSLLKGKRSGWRVKAHTWLTVANARSTNPCKRDYDYNPQKATVLRRKWQEGMMKQYEEVNAFVLDANNRPETRAT